MSAQEKKEIKKKNFLTIEKRSNNMKNNNTEVQLYNKQPRRFDFILDNWYQIILLLAQKLLICRLFSLLFHFLGALLLLT